MAPPPRIAKPVLDFFQRYPNEGHDTQDVANDLGFSRAQVNQAIMRLIGRGEPFVLTGPSMYVYKIDARQRETSAVDIMTIISNPLKDESVLLQDADGDIWRAVRMPF